MKIIKENKKIKEGTSIEQWTLKGNKVRILSNPEDINDLIKFGNQTLRQYGGKLVKISDSVVEVTVQSLINMAVSNLE